MKNSFITRGFNRTQKLGEDFAQQVKSGVIALYGDLGNGKTTFVQGLAKGLGIKSRIISPTFIIIRSYAINRKSVNAKHFYHIDLYRIQSEKDVVGMELLEIIDNPENIVAIEWPEKIEKILPKEVSRIYFKYIDENRREIIIKD
jgi:tRNA threonylcarbamoyladenosine biosynthesis protein TsaE